MLLRYPHRVETASWPKTPSETAIVAEMERHGLDRMPAIRRIQQRQVLRGRR